MPKVEIGGVTYIGAELIEPYYSLWSRWWPWSTPPRPYTHVMRRYWKRTLILGAILLVTLAWAIVSDKGTLKWWQRLLLLVAYTAVTAILAHDFW